MNRSIPAPPIARIRPNAVDASPSPQPWDGFVPGPENALAHACLLGLARGEGPELVVLHGPSGVGKSRLLQGLVADWLARRPEAAVALLEAEAFAAACAVAQERRDGWTELRARFRALDLFVLDDIHALERAPLALAELTHTVDALADAGGTIVVSARVGPGQWQGWPPRLVNRLVGGLSVRVAPPGLAARRRFLLERTRARGLRLTAGAVDLLADRADGYRTLEGWLAQLDLLARVERRPLDEALVTTLFADEPLPAPAGRPALTIDQIARAVAAQFKVSLRDLRSPTRRAAVTQPRHLAIYLARQHTGASYAALGAYFGRRDPATIRHACHAAAERLAADPALAASVSVLEIRS